jgi:hypothetical protein
MNARDRKRLEQLLREPAALESGGADAIHDFLSLPSTTAVLRLVEAPGTALVALVVNDRETALAAAVLAARAAHTAKILKKTGELVERAAARVNTALTARNDLPALRADVHRRVGPER